MRVRSHGPVTDEQQPTAAEKTPPTPESAPQSVNETPAPSEAPVTSGVSRRNLIIWTGAGVVAGAALGAGAVAIYYSQELTQNGTPQGDPGRRMPGGYGSGMPGGARPSGGPRRGASGMPSGFPTDLPTDQPT